MQRNFRNIAWLLAASLAVMAITIGAVLAHEGRPVDDYRLIVGWLHEPAYEGSQNAVSIRVNQIVEGEAQEHSEGGQQHAHDPTATPAPTESADSHEQGGQDHDPTPEASSTGDSHGHDGQDHDPTPEAVPMEDSHDHGGHDDETVAAASAMSVEVEAFVDSVSGVNVHVIPAGFTFAARSVNGEHVDGEGHAHVYVDGEKISRVYTPWVYLGDLEPGEHEIRATLNSNHHPEYTWSGQVVEATAHITVPEAHGHMHSPENVEADSLMAVSLTVEEDVIEGGNLFVATEGFTFAPQNAGGDHTAGEGLAHVYVNGVKIGRLYGHAMQLGKLAAGRNKVRVTLNTNDHSVYTWNGQPVEATVAVDIPEGMGGPGYGDPPSGSDKGGDKTDTDIDNPEGGHQDGDSTEGNGMVEKDGQSSVAPGPGAGKPLASVAGQHEGVAVPVEGLEGSLQVEVTHVSSGVSRTFDLEAVWEDPGHYSAGLIPTASGVYEFRFFGTIEETSIDETFISQGGGGDFDDVQSSAELQFPVQLPELREIESGARGALITAQEAQDAAMAAQEAAVSAQGGGGNALAVVALIIGIVGAALGAGGLFIALRGRPP